MLAACRLCSPRYLPVIDCGKDTVEKEVSVLQTFCDESRDALLTPIEGVPFPKLTSAKSAEWEAQRRKVTVGKNGHEDHITAMVPVGERGRAGSRMFLDVLLFSIIDSTLAGVPRTCPDNKGGHNKAFTG